jgi:hypothetical protein
VNLTEIYSVSHSTASEDTFFSAAHRTFSKIDYILEHKATLNKYKKTEITSCILADHNKIKLEISSKRNYRKYTTHGD